MEEILDQYASLCAAGFFDLFAPQWCTWAFEQGQIRFAARPDGWLLGLVVRSESDALPELDLLCHEFLSLELGD